jgi:hypothetical protein
VRRLHRLRVLLASAPRRSSARDERPATGGSCARLRLRAEAGTLLRIDLNLAARKRRDDDVLPAGETLRAVPAGCATRLLRASSGKAEKSVVSPDSWSGVPRTASESRSPVSTEA